MLTNLGLALLAILAGLLPLTFAGGTCDAALCVYQSYSTRHRKPSEPSTKKSGRSQPWECGTLHPCLLEYHSSRDSHQNRKANQGSGRELTHRIYPSGGAKWHGTDAAKTLTGNALNNIIKGFGGDDTLIGKAGNDILIGERATTSSMVVPVAIQLVCPGNQRYC